MLNEVRCPTTSSSHHLVEALCSMPRLTDVSLDGKDFQEEFYSTLNAKASTFQLFVLYILAMMNKCMYTCSSGDEFKWL